ncbi:MAG TPA: ROK family protein [Syntrophorhabdaceae bacterium]|nr:ROK family protein [Syntrophorhabdaceae bacterium]HNT69541.1 ROK family protein [Syntrophorhabdaceae bacterium]
MRIGIDIGGTKILAGLIDDSGSVIGKRKVPVGRDKRYEKVRAVIVDLLDDMLREKGLHGRSISKIGIACAGQIEKDTQKILFSPNLRWKNAPLKKDMEERFRVGVFVENDVNAATYGEWRFGLKSKPKDMIGIYPGTGIGGGIIANGALCRGFANVGGEVGHIILNPYGYRCNCGNYGCFEAYCGGSYIVERVRRVMREGYRGKIWEISGGDLKGLHAGHIEEAWMMGDDLCGRIWGEVIEYMGAGMASLVNLLNPEVIVMGGGVVYGTKYLVDEAKKAMEKRAMRASLKGLSVEKGKLGDEAAIIGAAFVE